MPHLIVMHGHGFRFSLARLPRRAADGCLLPLILALAGCAGFQPTQDDQAASMQEFGATTIAAELRFPELNNRAVGQLDARTFLQMVSVGIFAADDAATLAQLAAMMARVNERNRDAAMAIEKELMAQGRSNKGSGVPIAADGYIITAAHVVQRPFVLVLLLEHSASGVGIRCEQARVVFADADADIALVKCERATPRFLELRTDPVPVATTLFSGGWWNQSGAGRLIEARERRSKTGLSYREWRSSIPVLFGDSGSAVIDLDGRLLGVTVRSRFGRFWRQAPKSDAVMLDTAALERLIAADRSDGPTV